MLKVGAWGGGGCAQCTSKMNNEMRRMQLVVCLPATNRDARYTTLPIHLYNHIHKHIHTVGLVLE